MNQPNLDRCFSFINCQLQPPRAAQVAYRERLQRRAITISRQSGSGAHAVAEKLVEFLQARAPEGACPWTVFDRNLVEKVLEDHHLPGSLAKFMPEDRISGISDTMDELFGLHPPSMTLVRQSAETVLHLAELGNVILIGRGAAVITRNLDYVFHVRLVASMEKRIEYIRHLHHMTEAAARKLIKQEDVGRRRYLRKYFGKDIEDPTLYHLTINTDFVPYEEAAQIITDAVCPRDIGAEIEAAR